MSRGIAFVSRVASVLWRRAVFPLVAIPVSTVSVSIAVSVAVSIPVSVSIAVVVAVSPSVVVVVSTRFPVPGSDEFHFDICGRRHLNKNRRHLVKYLFKRVLSIFILIRYFKVLKCIIRDCSFITTLQFI